MLENAAPSEVEPPAQITTIIPTFKRPHLVGRAIRTVLAQTYPHFEVMVLDNASGDETRDIVSAIAATDDRVKYFCQPENIGCLKNFSFGMQRATTKFVTLLCDDDRLSPNFFADAIKALQEHPKALLFAGLVYERNSLDESPWKTPRRPAKPGLYSAPLGFFALFGEGTPRLWTGMCFRREVFEKLGTLDETLVAVQDYDLVMRVSLSAPVVLGNQVCGIYQRHDGSASASTSLATVWRGWDQLCRKVGDDPDLPMPLRRRVVSFIRRRRAGELAKYTLVSIRHGRFEQAEEAINFLEREFQYPLVARMLKALLREGIVGAGLRFIGKSVVIANRRWRGVKDI